VTAMARVTAIGQLTAMAVTEVAFGVRGHGLAVCQGGRAMLRVGQSKRMTPRMFSPSRMAW
jgi:hypothetical protein